MNDPYISSALNLQNLPHEYTCPSANDFNENMRSVIKTKSYPCTFCTKSFTRPSALKTHIYTHTAEKPFQCQSAGCGRKFSVVSNLRRHFKVHQRAYEKKKKAATEDQRKPVNQINSEELNVFPRAVMENKPDNFYDEYTSPGNNFNSNPRFITYPSPYTFDIQFLLPSIFEEGSFHPVTPVGSIPNFGTRDFPLIIDNNQTENKLLFNNKDDAILDNSFFTEHDFSYLWTTFPENPTPNSALLSKIPENKK